MPLLMTVKKKLRIEGLDDDKRHRSHQPSWKSICSKLERGTYIHTNVL